MTRRWPNFFLVGAAKAGTTSLHRYLGEHPEIQMSPVKEPNFFTGTLDTADDREAAIDAYLALFEDAGDATVVGESSPSYLWRPVAVERIAELVPDPRFAACLRDPVERAHSDYLMGIRRGSLDGPFAELIERELADPEPGEPTAFVERGRYHKHVARFVDAFGRDRFKVVLFEDLRSDTLSLLEDLASFLDVDPDAMAGVDHDTVHNPFGVPRNPLAEWMLNAEPVKAAARTLLPERARIYLGEHLLLEKPDKPAIEPVARELLVEAYAPEIDALEELLGRDLPELRRSWEGSESI